MPSISEMPDAFTPHRRAPFNGVKVCSATMMRQRDQLGEEVTAWLAARPHLQVADLVLTQSSDDSFHCITITVFYWEDPAPAR